MASLAEYFAQNRYHAKYELGDRVFGKWNKIPFIGSVGTDSVVSELEGPRITILLDLPIMFNGNVHNVIIVKHKDIKRLVSFDEESNDKNTNSKTSSKESVLDSNGRKRKSR